VAAVRGDRVYFEASPGGSGPDIVLVWNSATGTVRTVRSALALHTLNNAGTVAGLSLGRSYATACSGLVDVATGSRRWQTCDHVLNDFTPDDRLVIGAGTQRGDASVVPTEDGRLGPTTAVFDAATGDIRTEWYGGPAISKARPEDDGHVLMVASDDQLDPRTAIVRCAIRTGACELATPLTRIHKWEVDLL
jgi:hypothetical protein